MTIAYESNTDLGFDTEMLRKAGKEYKGVASELRTMAQELDRLLCDLKNSGWTTPAGNAFHEMTNTNWKDNIEKYARLLDMLNEALIASADEYDELMSSYVRTTKVQV